MLKTTLIAVLFALAVAGDSLASGSSPMRPPRLPRDRAAHSSEMDDAQYALGKSVFTGKAALTANAAATKSQRVRLDRIAAEVADRGGKPGANLPALAGRLSATQMDALEYYVGKRFNVR